ncbi:hypothetical protein HZH68_010740 [Vespula germanica]|uniref:Uncharacterized protein n=1 Tax=Vespula germanica TaxID=30212 RepID=A0A834JT24_VESGE|nr:hypothetical protein HZH68_010740 [Vespula germanica]
MVAESLAVSFKASLPWLAVTGKANGDGVVGEGGGREGGGEEGGGGRERGEGGEEETRSSTEGDRRGRRGIGEERTTRLRSRLIYLIALAGLQQGFNASPLGRLA